MRNRLTKAVVVAALLACAAPVHAVGPSRFSRPAGGERFQAGDSIEVSWTLDRSALRSFGEMELVLSLDGGRTFSVRVTGELSPKAGGLIWRVPSLPGAHLRLGLRGGSNEEPDAETIAAISEVFEITPAPGIAPQEIFRAQGEWRTRESTSTPVVPLSEGLRDEPTDQMRRAPSREIAAESPPPGVSVRANDLRFRGAVSTPRSKEIPQTIARPPLLDVPLRQ